jgi:hypothetical protein
MTQSRDGDGAEQFPLYQQFYGKPGGGISDSVWGTISIVIGLLFFLAGVAVLFGSARAYPPVETVIAELQAIRGVLMLILGWQMFGWGHNQRATALLGKKGLPS